MLGKSENVIDTKIKPPDKDDLIWWKRVCTVKTVFKFTHTTIKHNDKMIGLQR